MASPRTLSVCAWLRYADYLAMWDAIPVERRPWADVRIEHWGFCIVYWDHCIDCRVCPRLAHSLCPHAPGIKRRV